MNAPAFPHNLHPTITVAAIASELDREASSRMEAYRTEVAKGRMTVQQADYGQAIYRTMAEDCRRFAAAGHSQGNARGLIDTAAADWPLAAARRFTWAERRDALTSELDRRARHYPEWIAKGRLTQTDAALRTTRLNAALDLYEAGLDWPGTREEYWQIYTDFLLRHALADPAVLRARFPTLIFPAEQTPLAL